jgi:cell division septation protein DedD
MGRLVRISIYALIILILYFWITAVLKSYQKDNSTDVSNDLTTDVQLDTTSYDTLMTDTLLDDSDRLTNEDIVDGKVNYKALDEKVKKLEEKKPLETDKKSNVTPSNKPNTESKPALKPKPTIDNQDEVTSKSVTTIKGDGGAYMVMAGSYLLKENAVKMVTKLKKMGYTQAEVTVFQASEYHSVIAARFSTESKAKASAADLKRKGVDSFVKSK